jgi:tetratricopeptide (TPR) repeat protein
MNTYYTIEEKYLQATDKLDYGKTPKALQLLNEIISNDPFYAKAHYQLGKIYYYDLEDHQTAGYHFKTCMELDPAFPANYFHYLNLVVFLNMEPQVSYIAAKALTVPGVNTADIYNLLGLSAEKNKKWEKALTAYNDAFDAATYKNQREKIEDSIERIKTKMQRSKGYQYTVVE